MLRWLLSLQLGLCWVVFSGACGRPQEVQPLALTGLATDSLVEGDALELMGEGLPAGLAAEVELRGMLHAPGRPERAIRVSLSGRTLSPERLRATFAPDVLADWGRASFDGSLSVRARDAAAGTTFGAALQPLSFDLEAQSPRAAQQLRHSVEVLLEPLGLALSDGDSLTAGLPVARIQAGGPAWRAGLREGDAIVAGNGVRVHALGDLAPAPNATALVLQVRDARGLVRELRLPLAGTAPIVSPRGLAWCLLACPALLLLLAFLPLPAPGEWLRRAIEQGRLSRERVLWLPALFAVAAGFASVRFEALLDPFLVLLLHLGVLVTLRAWRTNGLRVFVAQALALWLAVACVAAASGSDAWLAIVRDQGTGPWAWNLFARPPLAAALLLCLRYAAGLHAPRSSELQSWPTRTLDSAGRGLLCALFGALFLGGSGVGVSMLVAGLCAGSKGLLCLALWSVLPVAPASPWRRELAWLAATLLATLAWSWAAPNRALELALGSALCVFVLFLSGVAWLQLRAAESGSPISPVSST